MPKELQEADKKINPDPQHLIQLFKQDSQRMKNFKDWPDREIKAITAPTLVMVGDRDVVTVEHALKISRLVQNGRLAVLPSGHGDYLEEAATTEGSGKLLSASAILILNFLGPAK
jgi:pimeloyl-ACP methyl ester carboxylesterase